MSILNLLFRSLQHWFRYRASEASAALAYFMPFALVPLLLISIQTMSFLVPRQRFTNLLQEWGDTLGVEVTSVMTNAVLSAMGGSSFLGVPFLGYVFFVGMVALAFAQLSSGLRRLWRKPIVYWTQYLYDLARGTVFFIVLQMFFVAVIVGEAIFATWQYWIFGVLAQVYLFTLTLILLTVGYRILVPAAPTRLACMVGASVVAALFMVLQITVTWWLSISPLTNVYGAASVLLAMLVWVYLTASVVYYGAAVAWVFDHQQLKQRLQ
jgi:membrane protein